MCVCGRRQGWHECDIFRKAEVRELEGNCLAVQDIAMEKIRIGQMTIEVPDYRQPPAYTIASEVKP